MLSMTNAVVILYMNIPHPGIGLWPDGGSVPGLAACSGSPCSATAGKTVVHTEGQGCSPGPHGYNSMERQ